jgi:hypothetical protein
MGGMPIEADVTAKRIHEEERLVFEQPAIRSVCALRSLLAECEHVSYTYTTWDDRLMLLSIWANLLYPRKVDGPLDAYFIEVEKCSASRCC